jgi:hypothetical protein
MFNLQREKAPRVGGSSPWLVGPGSFGPVVRQCIMGGAQLLTSWLESKEEEGTGVVLSSLRSRPQWPREKFPPPPNSATLRTKLLAHGPLGTPKLSVYLFMPYVAVWHTCNHSSKWVVSAPAACPLSSASCSDVDFHSCSPFVLTVSGRPWFICPV